LRDAERSRQDYDRFFETGLVRRYRWV